MPTYEWGAGFSVGHIGIDRQHKRLFSIVNDLHASTLKHEPLGEAALGKIIAELLDYTRSHFAEEEKLMEAAGYPGLPAHKQKHAALAEALAELEERLGNGHLREVGDILPALMGEWLAHHIAIEDQRYARFVTPYVASRRLHEGSRVPDQASLEERLLHLGRSLA